MAWKPPQQRSTLLDDIPQSSNFKKDALLLDYQDGLKFDESYVVRLVSLDPDDTCKVPCRKCSKTYTRKNGDPTTYPGVCVPDPGYPDNEKILDDAGTKMSDGDIAYTWLVPVFALYKCDDQSNIVEEIGEIRYIKYTAMVAQGIKDLQDDVDNGYGFETIPDYDVRLKKIKAKNGKPAYEVMAVRKIKVEGKMQNCPRFEQTLEEAMGEEGMAYLADNMEDMVAHIREVEAEMCDVKNVKNEFNRYRGDNAKDEKPAAVADKPRRAAAIAKAAPAVEEEPTEDEPAEEAPAVAAPKVAGIGLSRFPKLGKKA